MILTLHNLGKRKRTRKRYGRGNASGHGTFSGRGSKGQRARSGGKKGLKLKGFKQTLIQSPKFKGMKSHRPKPYIVALGVLYKNFVDGEKITPGTLLKKGLIKKMDAPVKILTDKKDFSLTKKWEIFGCAVSASARAIIEKAGGEIVIEGKDDKMKEK